MGGAYFAEAMEEDDAGMPAEVGGDDKKMADLCMSMGCYHAVSNILNMFEVPLPPGEELPFPEPPVTHGHRQKTSGLQD